MTLIPVLPPLLRRWLTLVGCLGALVAPAQSVAPNPSAAGLWVGEVSLNEVTHAAGGTNAPTADAAQFRILLHVNSAGAVRLLKEVTLARRAPANTGSHVLVSDTSQLPRIGKLLRVNGKLVAQRLASVAYDFDGSTLPLSGGVGGGFACEGTLMLAADHPTNPFRHRYHPEHGQGLPITRQLSLRFIQGATSSGGVDRLTGEYSEVITGLHKVPLTLRGSVVLNRISTVNTLTPVP